MEIQISARKQQRPMNLLSIGGSDPSSGAGIQSDVKAFTEFGTHVLTAVTAITSQNTSSFGLVEPVSSSMLKNQIESVLSDFKVGGIKIGMVFNSEIIKTIHQQLKKLRIPIVVDPVIKSTTGGMLIEGRAVKDFRKYIIPLATVITPNKFEAGILSNSKSSSKNTVEKIAKDIQGMGAKNIVITGIEEKNGKMADLVLEKDKRYRILGEKISNTNHGGGCNYSAAMTFAVANKKTIRESVRFAREFTFNSIRNAKKVGRGIKITDIHKEDKTRSALAQSINEFTRIKNIYKNIPECQTNFVYSKEDPKSTKDVMGLSGRIVRAEREVIVAGNLAYGGSKHVATALLAVNKKFPGTCSAINLKYQNSTIDKIKKSNFVMTSYDRTQEPGDNKRRGSTVAWGVKNSIKKLRMPPDVIFHRGDFGKEPMIIVFGETPGDTIKKLLKITG